MVHLWCNAKGMAPPTVPQSAGATLLSGVRSDLSASLDTSLSYRLYAMNRGVR